LRRSKRSKSKRSKSKRSKNRDKDSLGSRGRK
jgi:hypothetical protein